MIFRNKILTSVHSCIRNSWCTRERGRSKTNIRIPAGKCRSTPTGINSECFLLLKDPCIARAREHERSFASGTVYASITLNTLSCGTEEAFNFKIKDFDYIFFSTFEEFNFL